MSAMDGAMPFERWFHDVLDSAAEAFVVISEDQRIVLVNRAAIDLFGHRPEDIVGEDLACLLPAAMGHRHAEHVTAFFGSSVERRTMTERAELTARHASGREFPVEITISQFERAGGRFATAVIRDATERRRRERERGIEHERLRALVRHASDGIALVDVNGRIQFLSDQAAALVGREMRSLLGAKFSDMVHPADRTVQLREALAGAVGKDASTSLTVQARIVDPMDQWRWVELTISNHLDDLHLGGIVVNIRDVTAEKLADRRRSRLWWFGRRALEGEPAIGLMREACRLMQEELAASAALLLELDADNRAWTVHHETGDTRIWLGRRIEARTLLQPGDGPRVFISSDRPGPSTEPGGWTWVSGRTAAVGVMFRVDNGPTWAVVAYRERGNDFTAGDADFTQSIGTVLLTALDREQHDAELTRLAMHDPLTGLPNRMLFKERLEVAIARSAWTGRRAAVIYLDVDRFKRVNDSLGHAAGDELVAEVSTRLQRAIRRGDTLSRVGGDEFAVVCSDLAEEGEARAYAERLRLALAEPFDVAGRKLSVSASIGVALSEADTTSHTLIRDADTAMYVAKERSKGSVAVFDHAMRGRAVERLALESSLSRALQRNELGVVFQPIIETASGTTWAVEALMRWTHGIHGPIEPARFIPIAEESGLIVPIGEWMLGVALEQVAAWRLLRSSANLRVTVNISPGQLRSEHLLDSIAGALDRSGLPPDALTVEITETAIIEDLDLTQRRLHELRSLGVSTSLDDFGTGHSSFVHIRELPIDLLKIDRSFVDGMMTNQRDSAIVRAVVMLASSLGLSVVAEGVESAEQAMALRSMGCRLMQGYHFGRPSGAEQLGLLLLGRPTASSQAAEPIHPNHHLTHLR
jgi:diguanylate cyclase (GGDEF)-like protein/PAS domain S-box-containing protein